MVDLIGPYINKIEVHYNPLILKLLIITYDRENKFLRHAFIKYIIATENGIKSKCETTENTQANSILDRVHQVIVNLVCTYDL